jgi:lipopolysaccharide transport system ATP-binding protein
MQMLSRNRKRYFREFWALKDISFEVKKGETVGIVGRNGSGKSTLLQLICGILSPSSGDIYTSGHIAALLELGSGFNPEFSGRENVYLNGSVLGLTHNEIDKLFRQIVDFSEIEDFIDQPVKFYSSGMMVRLAFAVQAMIEPDLLIVDEALAVGDEKFQRKCFSRIEYLKSKGTSILFVSHSGPQVVDLCDRAILLEKGECLLQAKPSEVFRVYQSMIYAPITEQQKIVEQLKHNNSTSVSEILSSKEIETKKEESEIQVLSQINGFVDNFDPNLIPSTTTHYSEQGAKITGFEIQNLAGERVNILSPKNIYSFIFRGEVFQDLEQVYFGIHIKSISGTVITGQRFPREGSFIDIIQQGQYFKISFKFNLALLPGTYFVGGGVWAAQATCAHRIIDVAMFRIVPAEGQWSFGHCDLFAGHAKFMLSSI